MITRFLPTARRIRPAVVVALFAAAAANAQMVQLTADVDRNGALDPNADDHLEHLWSPQRGALFLNNNDSDPNTNSPDHADTVVNGTADVEDLASLSLRRIEGLSPNAVVTVSVDPGASGRARLFRQSGPGTYVNVPLGGSGNLSATQLAAGDIELRIEANQYATAAWNGEVLVTATVDGLGTDEVRLRVAPFIMLSNAAPATRLYIRQYTASSPTNTTMISQLASMLPGMGVALTTIPQNFPVGSPYPSNQIWLQDQMEIGYHEMPGKRMNVVLRANRSQAVDAYAQNEMMGPDFGFFTSGTYRASYAAGGGGNEWLDWFGNLEVTPPLAGYPFGRVYYGKNGAASLDPTIVAMLNAQGMQGPALALDTGWLEIKHVDEMICWVPTGNPAQPFKVLVPDTTATIALLDQWIAQGHGSKAFLSKFQSGWTVANTRANTSLMNTNTTLQANRINPMIEVIKAEWGLTEGDLIRVPSLYTSGGGAYIPSMVNAVVANGHLIMSAPNGPVNGGVDLMEAHMTGLLAGLAITPHYVEDQRYHRWSGNTHCATNVVRSGFDPAWYSSSVVVAAQDAFFAY